MNLHATDFNFVATRYIHNKTGNVYYVLSAAAIDCTNSRDGTSVVIYTDGKHMFVREHDEFLKKFTKDLYQELN